MNTTKKLVVAGIALALGMGTTANAAQKKEEDSAYKWGRWAVLSPAAGGEPYVSHLTPDAVNNARPGEADEFQPNVLEEDVTPPVAIDGFCEAGSSCGYATYSNLSDEEDGRVTFASVPEGFDLSEENPNGPVLARFNLETSPIDYGEGDFAAAAVVGEEDSDQIARFEVFDTGNENFPDIESVEMEGGEVYFSGVERSRTTNMSEDGSTGSSSLITKVSSIEKMYDFDATEAGSWSDQTETQTRITKSDSGGIPTVQFDFFSSGGFFVFGKTATIEQMETFAAGNVTAVYQGAVIDYGSAVTMEFDLGEKTVHGVFASENGFNGFHADGRVDGINFAGSNGDKKFTGSFFNAAENVSGAVNNGSQLGVFSADHVHP